MTALSCKGFQLVEHSISGHIVGTLWNGEHGSLPFSSTFSIRKAVGEIYRYPLRLRTLLRLHGGDFQDPKFSHDTEITLIRCKQEQTGIRILHKRTLYLVRWFPEYVDQNYETWEYVG